MALRYLVFLAAVASSCVAQNISFIETETSCDDDSGRIYQEYMLSVTNVDLLGKEWALGVT